MSRINISIPDDLKEQMDQFIDENWSAVAQEAFVTRVQINRLKGSDMQAAGIERLRASKKQNSEREHAEGVKFGKEWALEHADYDELQRVSVLRESNNGEEVEGYHLTLAINDDGDPNNSEIEETMDRVIGVEYPSISMVAGFIEGAGEIFDEV